MFGISQMVENKFIEIIEKLSKENDSNLQETFVTIKIVIDEKGQKSARITPFVKGNYKESKKVSDYV